MTKLVLKIKIANKCKTGFKTSHNLILIELLTPSNLPAELPD